MIALTTLLLVSLPGVPEIPLPAPNTDQDFTVSLGDQWRMLLGPRDSFYPAYVADPRRPTFALNSPSRRSL